MRRLAIHFIITSASLLVLSGCGNQVVNDSFNETPSPNPTSTPDDGEEQPVEPTDVAQPDRDEPPPCFNDGPFTLASGNPAGLANTVRERALEIGATIPGNGVPFRRSTGASGGSNQWTNLGIDHLDTLAEICRIMGYQQYVDSDCYDGEVSSRYPNGKCNYHSTGDNQHTLFNGTSWQVLNMSSGDKYVTTWVSSITCDATICEAKE